jgi:hypothetical protein
MADDGFDAGSIFVQVVPSFRDTQRIIEKESKSFGDRLEKDLSEGMERGAERGAKKASEKLSGLTDEVGKNADKSGEKAADEYAGAFRTKLQNALRSMEKELKPIEFNTGSTKALADLDRIKAKIAELNDAEIKPGMSTTKIRKDMDDLLRDLQNLGKDSEIEVKADFNEARRAAEAFKKYVESIDPKVELEVETKTAERQLGEFESKMKASIKGAMKAIGDQSGPELAKLKKRLESLSDADIDIDISAADALRELEDIHRDLAQINGTTATARVRVDSGKALAELILLNREVDKLDGQTAKVNARTKGRGLVSWLIGGTGTGGRGGEAATAFRTFNGVLLTAVTLGPALIPILAGIAGGLLAIGPAALSGVAGLGTLLLAFGGIGNALQALNQAETKSAKDSVTAARTMRNAAQGVEDAQRSLTRARRDAKQAGLDAAKAVADAEEEAAQRNADAARRVADTREQVARQTEAALKRQQDAEERLADTQRDATRAQEDLAAARLQAQKDLDDIADKSRQNALDIRQATIDLFDATTANNAVQADPGATNKEKEQSDINLKQAQLRLEQLRDTEKDLAEQKAKGDKGGVNGTDRVIQAQQRLNDALKAQKDAQDDVADSAAELRQTQTDGLQAVADALKAQKDAAKDGQDSIAAAVEAQRRAQVSAAESIGDAQRGLQRAQQSYSDALYDTGEQGSAAMQKVRDAMSKLGPDAQRFTLFIFGLRDEFYKLRNVAAAGILPGVQEALQTLITTYGPSLFKFVGDMSKVIGDFAVKLGQVLSTGVMKDFFGIFAQTAPLLAGEYGKGFLQWMQVIARLLIVSTPLALKFAGWLTDIGKKANEFLDSPEGIKIMGDFFRYIDRIAPKVEKFFKNLGAAVIAVAVAIAPVGEDILTVLTNVLGWIAAMDPKTLQLIVTAILAMAAAFQITAIAVVVLYAAINFFASPLQLIIVAILAVALGLYLLYTRSDTARKIIDAAFRGIAAVATWLFDNILKPAIAYTIWIWGVMGKAFSDVWNTILKPVFTVLGGIIVWLWKKVFLPYLKFIIDYWTVLAKTFSWVWNNLLWPVIKVIAKIVWELWLLGFKVAFAAIGKGWELLSNAFKWVWDHALKPLFDLFMKYIGDDLVKVFKSAVDLIKKHWDTIKQIAMAPISFVIDIVINKGLIAGFNKLADVFQMDKVDPIPWPPKGFARGGVYPGYTPGRDIGYIGISGGEAIMRPEWTRAMQQMDPSYIDEANRRARLGGVQGVRRFLGGFKNGGEVGSGSGTNIFARTTWRGKQFDYYTIQMIQAAEKLLGRTVDITQGSFSTSVAASGSTHAGGGALDISVRNLSTALRQATVAAFRSVGFAAWLRNPSQGPWPFHIHAIAAGDPTASDSAKRQVQDYYNGGNGLGGKDDGPDVKKDPSLLHRILGGIGDLAGWAKDALADPAKWLKAQIGEKLGQIKEKFGQNKLTDLLTKIPERFIDAMVDRIKGFNPFGGGDSSDLKSMAHEMINAQGWGAYWNDFDWLVNKESSWNPKAKNPTSSAYGLMQFLDGTWENGRTDDPREQLRQGINYIKSRYGNPAEARRFHEAHGWYKDGGVVPDTPAELFSTPTYFRDSGGTIPQGLSQVLNLTGDNEHAAVFTTDQWEHLQTGAGGDININVPMSPTRSTPAEVADEVLFAARRIRRGGAYLGANGSD